jgi:hypothetical protein
MEDEREGNEEMVDILISKGDNINEKNEENKEKDIKLE